MRRCIPSLFFPVFFTLFFGFFFSAGAVPLSPKAKDILGKVATRKEAQGFSARFFQESPLAAIGVVETATGSVWFKKPGGVRWEYETPEPMVYIIDNTTLWVHSPLDNQVWKGAADAFFGKNGGARFLTDITRVTDRFSLEVLARKEGVIPVKLVPLDPEDDLKEVYIFVDPSSYNIVKVRSIRTTGDETTLSFSDIKAEIPEASRFQFVVPKGAVVIPLQ
ncbi:MAG: outer membrane lipoprotein carrier protein LolA [Desulfobacterales bacterium]|nr:outer membrane lipoprotein carrier protein LolA [Desulfobacterales bacterium]